MKWGTLHIRIMTGIRLIFVALNKKDAFSRKATCVLSGGNVAWMAQNLVNFNEKKTEIVFGPNIIGMNIGTCITGL